MPMIVGRYDSGVLSKRRAKQVFGTLEDALRIVIGEVRPGKSGYGVTVEGDPFGPIALNQPDLRIYVFYHAEWLFTPEELDALASGFHAEVVKELEALQLNDVEVKVRFYERTGHAGAPSS